MKRCYISILIAALAIAGIRPAHAIPPDKLFYGGNVSLLLGSYFDIDIAPMVGYKFTPNFSAGILAKYEYAYFKNDVNPYRTNTFGGGPFARYNVSAIFTKQPAMYNIFIQTDYQLLYTTAKWNKESYKDTYTEHRWYWGAGLSVPIGERSSMYTYVAFDALSLFNNKNSGQPVISVGYQF